VPAKEDPAPQSRVQNRTVGLTKATNSGRQAPATTLRKDKPPQNNVQVGLAGLDLQASEGPRVLNALPFQGVGSCSARLAEVRGALARVALRYVMRRHSARKAGRNERDAATIGLAAIEGRVGNAFGKNV
jgi:hypothetical protein